VTIASWSTLRYWRGANSDIRDSSELGRKKFFLTV
jgi:hypothetical protein